MRHSHRHRIGRPRALLAAVLGGALLAMGQVPTHQQNPTLENPEQWERQASAALHTLLGSKQGEFDQDVYEKTLHDIHDLHTNPAMVRWHVEHARLQLKIQQQEQERRERQAALALNARRLAADRAQRAFNRRAEADGVWTREEIEEADRLHELALAAWESTPEEQKAIEEHAAVRAGVVTAIRQAAQHMGGLSEEEIAERRQNALMWDAATKTWRQATFTGQMVDQVHHSMQSQREIGIRATNVMIAAQLYMQRTDITEEQRAVARQVYDMAHRTRGYAAEAISKDIALVMFGTTADVAFLGLGRPISWVGGKAGQGARSLWTRLFGEAAESAGTGASAGTASTAGAAAAEAAAAREAAEAATTVRVPHAGTPAGTGAASSAGRTASNIAAETEALYIRALEKARELGIRPDKIEELVRGLEGSNASAGVLTRQVLHGIDDVERVIANARSLGVTEAEIQAAVARAQAAATPEAWVYQLGDDLAVALANRQGVTILVGPHEAAAFAEFTAHVPAARVLQMEAAALVRLETKVRLAARGVAVEWSAAERTLIDEIGRFIRQGGGESLLKWAEFSAVDKLHSIFRPDFVRLFEQVFAETTASRTAAATAPTVRLGTEATAPTVRTGAEATAPTVRTGAEATAPTVRTGAEATAPTVRTGSAAEAPTVRIGPEATAPAARVGGAAAAGAGVAGVAGASTAEAAEAAHDSASEHRNVPVNEGVPSAPKLTSSDPSTWETFPLFAGPPEKELPGDYFDGYWGYFDGDVLAGNDPVAAAAPADPTTQRMISIIDDLQPIVVIASRPAVEKGPAVARAARSLWNLLTRAGSAAGPRALAAGRGGHAARELWLEPLSSSDNAGPQKAGGSPAIRAFVTSLGTSTGEAFQVHIVNDSGRPVRLGGGSLVLEPIAGNARARLHQQVQELAGSKNVTTVKLTAYCLEFLRQPPSKGMMFRVASGDLQQRFAPMRSVLDAAKKLQQAGLLKPDSDPTAYFHAIRQWSIWTKEQGFDLKAFGKAFVDRTKQNLQELGQNWSKELEQAVRARVPGRWQDIQQVLREAAEIERSAIPR